MDLSKPCLWRTNREVREKKRHPTPSIPPIGVESKPNQGSTFTVTRPAATEPEMGNL